MAGGGTPGFDTPVSKKTLVVLVTFIVFTSALVAVGATVPKVKNFRAYAEHTPISIVGDQAFGQANGVTGGAGTEKDPYTIENWSITPGATTALEINNTHDFVVIRNCTIGQGGWFPQKVAITIHEAENVEIENVTIWGFVTGLSIEGSRSAPCANITVRNSAFSLCYFGVIAQNASHLGLNHSVFEEIEISGFTASNSTSIHVENTRISVWNAFGTEALNAWHFPKASIAVADSSDIILLGNHVEGGEWPEGSIAAARCSNVSIEENCLLASSSIAVDISNCADVNVSKNRVDHIEIDIDRSDNCLVADNVITDVWSVGIGVYASSNTSLVRNSVLYSDAGISAWYMNNSLIEGNLLANCTDSGLSAIGENIQIDRNVVVSAPDGVQLRGKNITFEWNVVQACKGYLWGNPHGGLRLVNSDKMTISNNSLSMNFPGLEISNCANVSLDHNNISDNITLWDDEALVIWGNFMHNVSVPTYFQFGNVSFDLGYPEGGNYWSQYTGIDLKSGPNQNMPGSDGIGDTPYQINATVADDYPLMSPPDSSDTEPPLTWGTATGYLGDHSWFISAVDVTILAYDVRTKVIGTFYRIDGGAWTTYDSPIMISSQGIHEFEYYSVDGGGNSEKPQSMTVKVDTEPPFTAEPKKVLRLSNTKSITIRPSFADNTSGIADYRASTYDGWSTNSPYSATPTVQLVLKSGNTTIYLNSVDEAGNWGSQEILIQDRLNENKQLLSTHGPFGIWFIVAILADLGLLAYLVHLRTYEVYGPAGRRPPRKGPGEIDKEEIVDGYPKYLKKV